MDHDGTANARLVVGQAIALVAVVYAPQHAMVGDHHVIADRNAVVGHDLAMAPDMDVVTQRKVLLTVDGARLLDADVISGHASESETRIGAFYLFFTRRRSDTSRRLTPRGQSITQMRIGAMTGTIKLRN